MGSCRILLVRRCATYVPPSSLPPPTTPSSSPPPPPLLQVCPRRPRPLSQCLPHPRPHRPPPLPPLPPCQTVPPAQSSCTFWRGRFEGLDAKPESETRRMSLWSRCHIINRVSIQQ